MNFPIEKIKKLIARYFNSFEAYMLTGSVAENRNRIKSDIDILALSKSVNRVIFENILHEKNCYQFIIFPYHKAKAMFYSDYHNGNSIYWSMIEKGIILKDSPDKMLQTLQNFRKYSHEQFNEREYRVLRHRITELLDDIDENNTEEENFFIAIELIKYIAQLITCEYAQKGKYLARKFIGCNRKDILLGCFTRYMQTKDITPLVSSIESILATYGGKLKYFTSNRSSILAGDNDMMIQFPGHTVFQPNIRKVIVDIISMLSSKDILYHVFSVGSNQYMEQGVYLSITLKNGNGIQNIVRQIDQYFKSQIDQFIKNDIRLSYSYQTSFHEGILWGGKKTHKELMPLFDEFSGLVWNDKIVPTVDKVPLLTFSMEIMIYIFRSLFDNAKEEMEFLDYYMEYSICDITDVNGIYNYSQLETAEKSIIRYYDELYIAQQDTFVKIRDFTVSLQGKDNQKYSKANAYYAFCSKLAKTLVSFSRDDLIYPNFYEPTNKTFILYRAVINHLFAIIHLTLQERFGVLYYLRNITREQ
ncbi:hypothetical protein [Viscerimonas tarda]